MLLKLLIGPPLLLRSQALEVSKQFQQLRRLCKHPGDGGGGGGDGDGGGGGGGGGDGGGGGGVRGVGVSQHN